MQNIDNKQVDKRFTKIAISGGCGFIGSELINYLNQQGYTNIDIFEKLDSLHNKWQNIAGLQFNAIYDYFDLLKYDVYSQYKWVLVIGGNSKSLMRMSLIPEFFCKPPTVSILFFVCTQFMNWRR